MNKKRNRIPIPTNTEEALRLARTVVAMHEQDGNASELQALKIPEFKAMVTIAQAEHDKALAYRRSAKHCTEIRDNTLGNGKRLTPNTIRHGLAAIRDVLAGIHKGEEHALGRWGFDVRGSSRVVPSPNGDQVKKA
jgi:hypothetical protein